MNALAMALQLLNALPTLIAAGIEVKGLIEEETAKLQTMADEGRDPTPAEWDALNTRIEGLRAELHKD
jgi:hypothetical protein